MGWIALVLFALLSAFGAAAQEAITPINQARLQRLEDEGVPRAKAIDRLLEQSEIVASVLLLLNTLAIAGATGGAVLVIAGYGASLPVILSVLVALLAGLCFAQFVGKSLALRDPKLTARTMERPVAVARVLLSPLARLFHGAVSFVLRAFGLKNGRSARVLDDEALFLLIGGVAEQGEQSEEHKMIHRIVELEDKTVREIMSPRIDVTAIEADASLAEITDVVVESGYSRIPVYEDSLDNVVGVLYAKDLFRLQRDGNESARARDLMRPAYFVPESKHIDELLRELQRSKVQIAIVVDEYGGTAGVVTIEDLLEEIVGEIRDEYDVEEEDRVQVLGDREVVIEASVPVDDVNRMLGLELETDGYDSLGGLVYHTLGKMPEPGDTFEVAGLQVTVLTTEGRRIGKVKIEQPLAPDGGEYEDAEPSRSWRGADGLARIR